MSINVGRDIPEIHEKLMGVSATEFAKSLACLPGVKPTVIGPDQYSFALDPGEVVINVTELEDLHIKGTLFVFPQRQVVFTFTGATQEARNAFVLQFDRTFQRGGG